jgi:hypothetical protein
MDIADQLQNQYCPDHWMRNRKWRWPFFIWGIGVAGVSAFKMYDLMYKKEKEEQHAQQGNRLRGVMTKKWSNHEFMVELVYNLFSLVRQLPTCRLRVNWMTGPFPPCGLCHHLNQPMRHWLTKTLT